MSDNKVLQYSKHTCVKHDIKYPDNPMNCHGQLCSDCPYTEKFRKRDKEEIEKMKKELNKKKGV